METLSILVYGLGFLNIKQDQLLFIKPDLIVNHLLKCHISRAKKIWLLKTFQRWDKYTKLSLKRKNVIQVTSPMNYHYWHVVRL